MRLDKYLADASLGTRSELKQLIRKGKVLVDGQPVTDPGFSLSGEEEIRYNGSVVLSQRLKYYMFYKPAGCVSATQDRERTVLDFFQPADGKDLFPVGRLDKDTEGLLLMTNDGAFAHKIMNPKKHVAKLYYFEGIGEFSEDATEQIEKGLDIGDDTPARPAQIAYVKRALGSHDTHNDMKRVHNSHDVYEDMKQSHDSHDMYEDMKQFHNSHDMYEDMKQSHNSHDTYEDMKQFHNSHDMYEDMKQSHDSHDMYGDMKRSHDLHDVHEDMRWSHNSHDAYNEMKRFHNSYDTYDACDERNLSGNYEKTLAINILSGQQIQDTACDTRGLLQITEGRYHQVKRMLKKCGVTVVYLKRLAVGGLYLDETLEKGTYRALTEEDFEKLGVK